MPSWQLLFMPSEAFAMESFFSSQYNWAEWCILLELWQFSQEFNFILREYWNTLLKVLQALFLLKLTQAKGIIESLVLFVLRSTVLTAVRKYTAKSQTSGYMTGVICHATKCPFSFLWHLACPKKVSKNAFSFLFQAKIFAISSMFGVQIFLLCTFRYRCNWNLQD